MIFLDTGYFIALFSPKDELHERAVAWSRVRSGRFLLTEYVLWECVNHFSSRFDRAKAHALVAYVQSAPAYELVPAAPGLFHAALELHAQAADKDWSLTDCGFIPRDAGTRY